MIHSEVRSLSMQLHRNGYNYPVVALDGDLNFPKCVSFKSTCDMDMYFNKLLLSSDPSKQILGYLGILFWGHYSGQDGVIREPRALGKVRLAYHGADNGNRHVMGILNIGIDRAAHYISMAIYHIENNQYANAINVLQKLPQIGFAFASKICTFIDPIKCGVIDSVIANNYTSMGFHVDAGGYLRNNAHNGILYNDYCHYLQLIALKLNANGKPMMWTDRDGSRHNWRAVDVERGFYCA